VICNIPTPFFQSAFLTARRRIMQTALPSAGEKRKVGRWKTYRLDSMTNIFVYSKNVLYGFA